jgi:hypothetical protein
VSLLAEISRFLNRKVFRILEFKLYRISTNQVEGLDDWPEYFMGYKLVIYNPGLSFKPKHGTNFIRNVVWYIITSGRHLYLFLYDQNVLVHSKEISPYNFRFRYMNRNDIHHQQAFTNPDYRDVEYLQISLG